MIRSLSVIILGVFLAACDSFVNADRDKHLVAEAYGHRLYEEELKDYLRAVVLPEDSVFEASRYIDKWLMDVILYEEAKKNIKNKQHIQNLVKDYEQSLLISELENTIIKNGLDTIIQRAEIDSFYSNNVQDFKLEEPIVRLLYLKVPTNYNNDTLETLWETEDLPALKVFAKKHSGLSLLELGEWHKISVIKSLMPEDLFDKISLKRPNDYSLEENDQHFYLKILEIIDENELPPVSFVKERIRLRILQDRIKSLLKARKAALFNEKIKSKDIKIYGKDTKY